MAGPPYVLDFGSSNVGLTPTFTVFKNEATGASLTPPSITEDEQGLYEFTFVWTTAYPGVTAIRFKAVCNGVEMSDVITRDPYPGTASATGSTSSTSGYSTAGTLVNRAALQLGLLGSTVASAADPFSSSDPNFIQLIDYLNTTGQDLNHAYAWQQITKECTISTASSATSYALPADFLAMVDQTGWNRTTRLPLLGPLSSQDTQLLKARLNGTLINVAFRLQGNLIVFPVAPPNSQSIVFEYVSSYWAQSAASVTGPDKSAVTLTTDYVCHDPELVLAAIKLRWSEDRGFDTVQLRRRYEDRLEFCIGANNGANTLDLAPRQYGDRVIDVWNIPVTGYGS